MKKVLPLFGLFILTAFAATAQNVKGLVKDVEGIALANASVSLLNAKDSSVVKLAITNKTGEYQFKNIKRRRFN